MRTVVSHGSFLHADLGAFLAAAADAGFDGVDVWRHAPGFAIDRVAASGVPVAAMCAGTASHGAIDDAATLGAAHLVVTAGPATSDSPERDLCVALERLLPHAAQAGVVLALEPFHPMFIADRSWLVTLGQANDVVAAFDSPFLGIALDCYHVWWDPDFEPQLRRAAGRIAGVHVADWIPPSPDHLRGRGLPGEGVIPVERFLQRVTGTGYAGTVEIEVLNDRFTEQPVPDAARTLKAALDAVLGGSERKPT